MFSEEAIARLRTPQRINAGADDGVTSHLAPPGKTRLLVARDCCLGSSIKMWALSTGQSIEQATHGSQCCDGDPRTSALHGQQETRVPFGGRTTYLDGDRARIAAVAGGRQGVHRVNDGERLLAQLISPGGHHLRPGSGNPSVGKERT